MLDNKQLGNWGENIAVGHLKKNKYKIIAQNWQNKWGEIDIIAKKKKTLVFVEVKTTKKQIEFSPTDKIDYKKQKQLVKMAQIYLSSNKISLEIPYQIDVIAIELFSGETKITHLQNVLEDNF